MTDVELLDLVDRLDRERARLQGDAERLDTAVHEAVTARADRERELAAARAAHEANRAEERTSERRIDELREKRASAMRVLETGAGDPAAAERQVQNCDRLIDEAETVLLGVLETHDRTRRALDDAGSRLQQAERVLQTAEKEMPPRAADMRSRAAELGARLDAAMAELPADLRSRYRGLRERGRWPVARINKQNACDACNQATPAQDRSDVKKGRLLECHGCKRWLLVTPG